MSTKAWGGRFKEKNEEIFERMNRSLGFDIRMFREDILLNKTYSKELNRIGMLTDEEFKSIETGLTELENDIEEKGLSLFRADIEDIHMGVEELLSQKIGSAAKKMHAGKSRNDQVATDVRKYILNEIPVISDLLKDLLQNLLDVAENNKDVMMPGFTHLRQAQPVLFAHYIMSFFFSFTRDYTRLQDSIKRISVMPLGSAALAGSAFPLDRENLRKGLGFETMTDNSMDGVLARDFILEMLSNISIMSLTLSRFAEDFIIFSSEQYNFFILSDKITTGSSIMPNKKNPDSLELTRGKTGRILGNFVTLFTVLKAIPTTYNKDLQEDKESLFDSIDTIKDLLHVTNILLESLKINKEVMENSIDPLSFATELADYLAQQNLPFREAHHVVGNIVLECVEGNKKLTELTESDLLEYHAKFKNIGDNWGNKETFLAKRDLDGGTGRKSLEKQFEAAKEFLK